jgi:hypothetical protein
MEASTKDGAHKGSGGAKTMRVRYEVMRYDRGDRGRHMVEDDKRRGEEMGYNGHILMGGRRGRERDTWQVVSG